ncbi:MAG: hypothetical protein H0W56_11450, partial [Acidothermales bacterium]|nr:hypothetical protein [Acidothermales bacterium]
MQEQNSFMGKRGGSGLGYSAAAADDRGGGRGVVRVLERRPNDERAARRQAPGDGVDGGDLERGVEVQRRQQPRHPLGQHRLAAPGRTEQQCVVAACRSDLDRGTTQRLPRDVEHVRSGLRRRLPAGHPRRLVVRLAGQQRHQ